MASHGVCVQVDWYGIRWTGIEWWTGMECMESVYGIRLPFNL